MRKGTVYISVVFFLIAVFVINSKSHGADSPQIDINISAIKSNSFSYADYQKSQVKLSELMESYNYDDAIALADALLEWIKTKYSESDSDYVQFKNAVSRMRKLSSYPESFQKQASETSRKVHEQFLPYRSAMLHKVEKPNLESIEKIGALASDIVQSYQELKSLDYYTELQAHEILMLT